MAMRKIRKGDEVVVIAGKDKGKQGSVLRVIDDEKVVVENVNMVKKHTKANPNKGEPGGILDKEMPLHISNVAIVNPTEQPRELTVNLEGARVERDGTLWCIAHTDPKAYNDPGKEPKVVIDERQVTDVSNDVRVPPLSINLYKFAVRR